MRIPWLNVRAATAAAMFAATLGGSMLLVRAQMMFPQIRDLTGGEEGGFLDRVGDFFRSLWPF